jgi:DNA-binding XRE family transcriptional regulator
MTTNDDIFDLADISGVAIARAREKLGMGQDEFGRTFRPQIRQQTIQKIEKYRPGEAVGDVIKASKTKWRVCARLGLLPVNVSDMSNMTKGSQEPVAQAHHLPYFRPRLAEGGMMLVPSTKAQSTTERPSYIAAPDAWAMEMVGTTMWPEFRDGATLFVNPAVTPEAGMGCVFLNPDRTKFRVLVFAEKTADGWLTEQWNPSEAIVLSEAEWPYCEPIEAVHAPHKRGMQK